MKIKPPRERKGQHGTPESFFAEVMKEPLRRRLPTPRFQAYVTCCPDVVKRDFAGNWAWYCERHNKAFNPWLVAKALL